jgi:hypothetical protein
MSSHAHVPTGYTSCLFPGDIMSNHFYNRYSQKPNKGELLSKFLVYEFEHITNKGRMYVIKISFSQPGFMDQ